MRMSLAEREVAVKAAQVQKRLAFIFLSQFTIRILNPKDSGFSNPEDLKRGR